MNQHTSQKNKRGQRTGCHPTDATDAAEDRDDVPAILGESPRRDRWEVENGHVVDQLMAGKTKTEEHTQLHERKENEFEEE